jgi:hypothetical protein
MTLRSTDSGLDEHETKLLETLEKWGWFVTKVGAGDVEPAFAYSMGLYENFHHPEIVVFGLNLDLMHRLINFACERIREGQKYEEGQEYGDFRISPSRTFALRRSTQLHHLVLPRFAFSRSSIGLA